MAQRELRKVNTPNVCKDDKSLVGG